MTIRTHVRERTAKHMAHVRKAEEVAEKNTASVVYGACYVYKYRHEEKEQGVEFSKYLSSDDILNHYKKNNNSRELGKECKRSWWHPDQKFWDPDYALYGGATTGRLQQAKTLIGKLGSAVESFRIEVDCNIMPCDSEGTKSCWAVVPQLITNLLGDGGKYPYGIAIYAHNAYHYQAHGRLCLRGASSSNTEYWQHVYTHVGHFPDNYDDDLLAGYEQWQWKSGL